MSAERCKIHSFVRIKRFNTVFIYCPSALKRFMSIFIIKQFPLGNRTRSYIVPQCFVLISRCPNCYRIRAQCNLLSIIWDNQRFRVGYIQSKQIRLAYHFCPITPRSIMGTISHQNESYPVLYSLFPTQFRSFVSSNQTHCIVSIQHCCCRRFPNKNRVRFRICSAFLQTIDIGFHSQHAMTITTAEICINKNICSNISIFLAHPTIQENRRHKITNPESIIFRHTTPLFSLVI